MTEAEQIIWLARERVELDTDYRRAYYEALLARAEIEDHQLRAAQAQLDVWKPFERLQEVGAQLEQLCARRQLGA